MSRAFIIASGGRQDGVGSLDTLNAVCKQVTETGLKLERLVIDPLGAGWDTPIAKNHFRTGCGPLEALAFAQTQLREGAFEAVLIEGSDAVKTGYTPEERASLTQVYGKNYPLTEAYTDLTKSFCREEGMNFDQFRDLRDAVFENYQGTAPDKVVDPKWLEAQTDLFRGVDCANPYVDYTGGLLLTREDLLDKFELTEPVIEVAGVGMGYAQGDGVDFLEELATYWHLEKALYYANLEAGINFAKVFNAGKALLEAYTCYPVVPLALLLHGKFVNNWQEIPAWLEAHALTLNGGMNLNRAPWNLPALRALIEMTQALHSDEKHLGGVQGNGGLGYKQGFAILRRNA